MAKKFLADAKEEFQAYLNTGDEEKLRQACEKGWGAVAQLLMHASGKELTHHREFGIVVKQLAEKTGYRIIKRAEMAGEALHAGCFYHGALSPEAVEEALNMISELLKIVESLPPSA
ncbi:MAG: Archaeal PaREP1/PaREP8 family protein [Candidatus Bathyarchaeota archaeon BA1]|nr:MAG: Archaeal PaREP1/PaREP8 family protein [Candidatus Bathyarchaeota archaeon BA1]